MTRYARAGRGTHQRVAKDPTPWDELKPPPPQRKKGSDPNGNGPVKRNRAINRKERFTKSDHPKTQSSHENVVEKDDDGNNEAEEIHRGSNRNSNIRGFGQSKSVKILGQFWVPLEDAKRLKSLLKKLKAQGLPRKEILESLKNERRKAEKASKRQRDKTCFQCRQFGHVLSDCPNLKKAVAVPGLENDEAEDESNEIADQGLVCFKCGSTEHTSRKCKRKGEKFEFAKCFICSGTGHIARQCPKNEKGIYPSGGSCSECGSITHLKKDCPDLVGVEAEVSKDGNDSDAVTLRLADPFCSTEYEPVQDLELGGEGAETEANDTSVEEVKMATKAKVGTGKKQKQKGKRKSQNEEDGSFEFNVESFQAPKNLLGSNPKKRKVVKF